MRKYHTTLFTLLSTLLVTLFPVGSSAQVFAGQQCEDPTQSLLWQVEGSALQEKGITLHLFGSIHVGKPGFYPLPKEVNNLVMQADKLVFEVNPEIASDPRVAMQLQLRGVLPSGQTIEQVVSPATLQKLQTVLDSMGIPLANFSHYKPWMIAMLLTNLQASALGFDPAWGLESYLLRNKSTQTQILELESLQLQLDLLDSFDPELFLGYSLEEYDNSATVMNDMVQAWLCGESEALEKIVLSSTALLDDTNPQEAAGLQEIFDRLFTRRNLHMADGIEAFADSGRYFVVVGAAHLLGAGSVVDLLQQRGYRVTPVILEP